MEKYRKVKIVGKGSFGYAVLVESKKGCLSKDRRRLRDRLSANTGLKECIKYDLISR